MLAKANIVREELPKALKGLKAASTAMPHVRLFIDNFTKSLNLDEDLDKVHLKGSAIDLLGCECFEK